MNSLLPLYSTLGGVAPLSGSNRGGKEVSNVVRVRGLDCYVCIPEVLSKSKTIDQLLVVILSWTLFNAT